MTTPWGRFVWYELVTTDPRAATAFYGAVIGWTAADAGLPDRRYTILSTGDAPLGGLMELPQEMRDAGGRPAWIGYIGAEDVDAAAERVRAAGGQIHRAPDDIPGVGRFAVIGDPQGAAVCLFRGNDCDAPVPPPVSMAPGRVGWHELYANDFDAAVGFYTDHFGWAKETALEMGEMGTYQIFAIDGVAAGGMMKRPPMVPASFWQFYFAVPEIGPAMERVKQAGGTVLNGPMEVPGGALIAQCLDPQGATFAMVAPPRG